jgi:hypothetical protein
VGNESGREFLCIIRCRFKPVYLGIFITVYPDDERPALLGPRKRPDLLPGLSRQAALLRLRVSGQGYKAANDGSRERSAKARPEDTPFHR